MTNKEDDGEQFDPDMVALLAMHFVSQVLDEAYVIANSAKESGQSWRFFTKFQNITNNATHEDLGDISNVLKDDCELNANITDNPTDVIITSTPQKLSDENKLKLESICIGQGDEDLVERLDELTNSTSMYIHELFDMSKVEGAMLCNDSGNMQSTSNIMDLSPEAIISSDLQKINNYEVSNLPHPLDLEPVHIQAQRSCGCTEYSEFSYLDDANSADVCKGSYLIFESEGSHNTRNDFVEPKSNKTKELVQEHLKEDNKNKLEGFEEAREEGPALSEDIYLTLNRDYEQYSEDDTEPVLEDLKGLTFQEVKLLTANTSDNSVSPTIELLQVRKSPELLRAAVTSGSCSRKSTLVRRCHRRGARLLSCFRSWWPFKSRKTKESFGTVHSAWPLSPEAGRRASNSLDQKLFCSSTTLNDVTWKFNTVTSTRWKDYAFENKTDGFGE